MTSLHLHQLSLRCLWDIQEEMLRNEHLNWGFSLESRQHTSSKVMEATTGMDDITLGEHLEGSEKGIKDRALNNKQQSMVG